MKALSLLRLAAVLLVGAVGVGWVVEDQRAAINERHRLGSEALARVTLYSEQLGSMLTIGVLEQDLFRVASYESVRAELDGSLEEAQKLTAGLRLSSEMDSLISSDQGLRMVQQQILAWAYGDMWKESRRVLLDDNYVMARKLHEIDLESVVLALRLELGRHAQWLNQAYNGVLLLQIMAVLLVVWTSVRYSLLLRTQVKELAQLQALQVNREEVVQAQVQERTAELKEDNHRLMRLSTTDPLTGLANRRMLDDTMVREFLRAQRSASYLAVALVDVDWFKPYNDYYGHQAGDTCLQAVANILARTVTRAGDLVARYGGEEFVVVAPVTDLEGIREVARRIQHNLESIGLPHERSPLQRVTVSIGVAACIPGQSSGMTPESLLQLADMVLYKAKQSGRNCVISAVEMDESLLVAQASSNVS